MTSPLYMTAFIWQLVVLLWAAAADEDQILCQARNSEGTCPRNTVGSAMLQMELATHTATIEPEDDIMAAVEQQLSARSQGPKDHCMDSMLGDFECDEYKACVAMSLRVFGGNTIVNPTDEQVHQLEEECEKEEAAVRAAAADLPENESKWDLQFADALLPKCQRIEKALMVFLHSMTHDYYNTVDGFCAFVVDWVIPVERTGPCHGFMEEVSTAVAIHDGVVQTWPVLTLEESFSRSFFEVCHAEHGMVSCDEKKASVEELSRRHMQELDLNVPQPASNSTPPWSQIPQETHDQLLEKYIGEVCSALNLTGHLEITNPNQADGADADTSLLQQSTGFILTMATLIEVAASKSAYYRSANADAQVIGGVSYDSGYGYGYHRRVDRGLAYFIQVKYGWFSSKCVTIGLPGGFSVGLGVTRFNSYGNIEGYSKVIGAEAAKGFGAGGGVVWCCSSGSRDKNHNPVGVSNCGHCGVQVTVSAGIEASVNMAMCYTTKHWERVVEIPFPIPKIPDWLPGCFPGNALVETESGPKRMDSLQVGDRVLSVTGGGSAAFEEVYFFGHADPAAQALFLSLTLGDSEIRVSPDHFIPRCKRHFEPCRWQERVEVYAEDLEIADKIWVKVGSGRLELKVLSSIEALTATGLFNPYTPSGTIIVNGIVASCHSSWILDAYTPESLQPWLPVIYNGLFLPAKILYQTAGVSAIGALDLGNPQTSPDTFGHGPVALSVVVACLLSMVPLVSTFAMKHRTYFSSHFRKLVRHVQSHAPSGLKNL